MALKSWILSIYRQRGLKRMLGRMHLKALSLLMGEFAEEYSRVLGETLKRYLTDYN